MNDKRKDRKTGASAATGNLRKPAVLEQILRNLEACCPATVQRLANGESTPDHALLQAAAYILGAAKGTHWGVKHAKALAEAIGDLLIDPECPRFAESGNVEGATPWEEVWTEADPPATFVWHGHPYDKHKKSKATNYWKQAGAPFRTSIKLDGGWVGSYARRDAWDAIQEGRSLDVLVPDPIPRVTKFQTPVRVIVVGEVFVRVRKEHSQPSLSTARRFLVENGLEHLAVKKPRHKIGTLMWIHEDAYRIMQKTKRVSPNRKLGAFVADSIRQMLKSHGG